MTLTTKRLSPTHRLSITEIELQALTSLLDSTRSSNQNKLSLELASIRRKCKNLIEKILTGEKLPDYVPGSSVKGSPKISLEMLGEKEETYQLESSYEPLASPLKDNINEFSHTNSSHISSNIRPRNSPDIPSDDEFLAAEMELAEAIQHSKTARMSASEWEEQRKLYPFLPEIQPD